MEMERLMIRKQMFTNNDLDSQSSFLDNHSILKFWRLKVKCKKKSVVHICTFLSGRMYFYNKQNVYSEEYLPTYLFLYEFIILSSKNKQRDVFLFVLELNCVDVFYKQTKLAHKEKKDLSIGTQFHRSYFEFRKGSSSYLVSSFTRKGQGVRGPRCTYNIFITNTREIEPRAAHDTSLSSVE